MYSPVYFLMTVLTTPQKLLQSYFRNSFLLVLVLDIYLFIHFYSLTLTLQELLVKALQRQSYHIATLVHELSLKLE